MWDYLGDHFSWCNRAASKEGSNLQDLQRTKFIFTFVSLYAGSTSFQRMIKHAYMIENTQIILLCRKGAMICNEVSRCQQDRLQNQALHSLMRLQPVRMEVRTRSITLELDSARKANFLSINVSGLPPSNAWPALTVFILTLHPHFTQHNLCHSRCIFQASKDT